MGKAALTCLLSVNTPEKLPEELGEHTHGLAAVIWVLPEGRIA